MTLVFFAYWLGTFIVAILIAGKVHKWEMGVSLKMAFHLTNCAFVVLCLGVGIYQDHKTYLKSKPKELTAHVAETPQIRTQC